MKDCEPLREKKQELLDKLLVQVNEMTSNQKGTGFDKGYNLGFETAIDCAFDRFASAFRFYKRYRDNKSRLEKERFDVYEKYITSGEPEGDSTVDYEKHYNEWLLNYSFKDAI